MTLQSAIVPLLPRLHLSLVLGLNAPGLLLAFFHLTLTDLIPTIIWVDNGWLRAERDRDAISGSTREMKPRSAQEAGEKYNPCFETHFTNYLRAGRDLTDPLTKLPPFPLRLRG